MGASQRSETESRTLSGWGRTAPTHATVSDVSTPEQAAAALEKAGPRGVLARGLGRSYGDAAQNAGGQVLCMPALAGIYHLDAEHGTITAAAGTSLGSLIDAMLPCGWFLPVVPGTRDVTLGGAIASDIHGKNHHRDGGFARHIESLQLLTPSGRLVEASSVECPDIFWATAGGMGLTGVILRATVCLQPIETTQMRVLTERVATLDDALEVLGAEDPYGRYGVAWLDLLAPGKFAGRGVVSRGDHATADELPGRQAARTHDDQADRARATAPGWLPINMVRRSAIAVANEARYRAAPVRRRQLVPLHSFFFPLDSLRCWNRLYGPGGFVQYQLAIPHGRENTLDTVVQSVCAAHVCPALCTLKRLGRQEGMLSFPLAGWTLAIDFPARDVGLPGLLDRLDVLVADAGGRIYLTKDARLRPELVGAMMPALPAWRRVRRQQDPDGIMCSDLARRLALL